MAIPKWADILREYKFSEPIHVTRPILPSLDSYTDQLREVWDSRWITNDGVLHKRLEKNLENYLGVDHLNLFCNGTIALLVALQALDIREGEVITTPFTFPATPHALHWNHISPVFCDIAAGTYNLDPNCLEELITPATKAILPVHVFGVPCDTEAIQEIADRHGLPVIYDAAHAFGVKHRGRALVDYGDLAILSFHATKLFTTGEGGALISHTPETKERIHYLKNFGIAGEESVLYPGINGKMSELHAGLGLLNLESVDDEIAKRKALTQHYRKALQDIPGLTFSSDPPDAKPNYAYFPVLIDEGEFGLSRDEVHDALCSINIVPRKYFYPLCSHYPSYDTLPSASPDNLPVAERVAEHALCLPLYGDLSTGTTESISAAIAALQKLNTRT